MVRFHYQPNLDYLAKLAQESALLRQLYKKEEEQLEIAIYYDALKFSKEYNGIESYLAYLDSKYLQFFPKKFNRIHHTIKPNIMTESDSFNFRTLMILGDHFEKYH